MVAYSFRPQFVEPIRAGTKAQTMRNERKRHARPGELIQLYTGMRTRNCHAIGTATCLHLYPVRLTLAGGGGVAFPEQGMFLTTPSALDRFAVKDGFLNWSDLVMFWNHEHPEVAGAWSGVLIRWSAFRLPAVASGA